MNEHNELSPDEGTLDTLSAIGLVLFALGITISYWLLAQSVESLTALDGNIPPKGYTLLLP